MADDDTKIEPCRLVVEPGDLFSLALAMPAHKRREALTAAALAEMTMLKPEEGEE